MVRPAKIATLRRDAAFTSVRDASARGVTLIELLIVITILLMLLAVGVPLMRPSIENGRIREAARQVNAYCALAKARAVELGRPAGVWLERSAPGSNAAFDMFLAEMPPTYSGDVEGATVRFTDDRVPGRWIADLREAWSFEFSETMHGMFNVQSANVFSGALIKPGETFFIRFNFKGPVYQITRGKSQPPHDPSIPHPAQFALAPGVRPPIGASFPDGQPGVPFQIFQAPVRTSGRPLQLSGGACVDLGNSGFGIDGLQFWTGLATDEYPVVIMFFPSGGVERIVVGGVPVSPTGMIHLLVGTTGGLDLAANSPESPNGIRVSAFDDTIVNYNQNIANGESVWVSVGHRTGSISSSQNGWELLPPPPWPGNAPAKPFFQNSFRAAREYAQTAQTMGGG